MVFHGLVFIVDYTNFFLFILVIHIVILIHIVIKILLLILLLKLVFLFRVVLLLNLLHLLNMLNFLLIILYYIYPIFITVFIHHFLLIFLSLFSFLTHFLYFLIRALVYIILLRFTWLSWIINLFFFSFSFNKHYYILNSFLINGSGLTTDWASNAEFFNRVTFFRILFQITGRTH